MGLETTIKIDEAAPYNHRIGRDAMPGALQAAPSPPGSHLTDLQRAIIWPNFSTAQRESYAAVLGMGMNIVCGDGAMQYASDTTHCIAAGHLAMQGDPNVPGAGHNYGVIGVGFRTFYKLRGARYSTAYGIDCCSGVINGNNITANGAHVATLCETVIDSILSGVSTCYNAEEVIDSIVIGDRAADGGPELTYRSKIKHCFIHGHRAGRYVTGAHNHASGNDAFGSGKLAGSYNHADGRAALKALAGTSQGNTAVGDGANTGLVNGHETTALGHNTQVMHSYSTAVGSGAATTKTYQVMLGGTATKEVATRGAYALNEMPRPSPPEANRALLYLEDNGAGKSRLMIQFATGGPIQIAVQQ